MVCSMHTHKQCCSPLPVPPQFPPPPFAEDEVITMKGILNRAEVQVRPENFFRSDRKPRATKGRVKKTLEGTGWGHLALNGTAMQRFCKKKT